MDIQYHGANCISVSYKGTRVIIDDNLADLGAKPVTKPDDVALFTGSHGQSSGRLTFDGPGEYEVGDISVTGIAARSHLDEDPKSKNATMFKLTAGEQSLLVTGHIYPELSETQLEAIGIIDLLIVPVGGSGYTVDPIGALKLIKDIEPKQVVPVHYADKALNFPVTQQELSVALQEMAMESKEAVSKLKLKPTEASDTTQLVILEKS
jgi:L-ascorbate metabolism protein UlaG (beta-lactamase superfamily)